MGGDDKVLCVFVDDFCCVGFIDFDDVGSMIFMEIEYFFIVYKDLEFGKLVEGVIWIDCDEVEVEIKVFFECVKGIFYENLYIVWFICILVLF